MHYDLIFSFWLNFALFLDYSSEPISFDCGEDLWENGFAILTYFKEIKL